MRGGVISRRGLMAGGLAVAVGPLPASAASQGELVAADGRKVLVMTWPAVGAQRGHILFSHGALSAPDLYPGLIGRWTRAGFRVAGPLHVDSTRHPDHGRYGMVDSWRARLLDMQALAKATPGSTFIAAGHSYGALVALTLGGAGAVPPPGWSGPLGDARTRAVVGFSPPGATPGLIDRDGYAALAVPALIETGTADVPPSPGLDWRVHLTAYDAAAPGGDRYALVLPGVDHYFGGLICNPDKPGPPQAQALEAAADLSATFMAAYGLGDLMARRTLDAGLATEGPTGLHKR